jgi:ketosteroid isomerase-like protein
MSPSVAGNEGTVSVTASQRIRRNVELSREGFRRFEAADMDGLIALYGKDAEIWHPEGWPEPGPTVGRGAIKRQFETVRQEWTDGHLIVDEIEGRGDWVVARVRWQARGGESGAHVEVRWSAATRFDGDLIAEVRYFWSHEDALAAAGWPTR